MSATGLRTDVPAFLHPFARPAAPAGSYLRIVSGRGATVRDADGREYVDAMASLWYCNVGHGRREVRDAITRQLDTLEAFHAFERFTNDPAEALAQRLRRLAPMPDARVFLTSSGSEAVDSAIKIARATHSVAGDGQRRLVISRAPSYHGVTYGGMAATGLPANQAHFGEMLGDVVQVAHDDLEAVAAIFADRGDEVAAVIAEPVIGAGGVHPPAPGYLRGLRELCTAHGALLILDEVICAFGRLGRWFGADHYGVTPDLLTFAKAVTSGYVPLGGVLVGRAVRRVLEADEAFVLKHGHTYSGHPVACAAALACLDVTEGEGLLDAAVKVGERLSAGLEALARDGLVADVRGAGAVWAVQPRPGQSAVALRDAMLADGVIPRPIGQDTLAFCPPLVITDAQLDRCVDVLERAARTTLTEG